MPGGEHREVVLIQVGDGLRVVRGELALRDLVHPRAHQLTEQLPARLATDRFGDHSDGVLGFDEAEWHPSSSSEWGDDDVVHGTRCVGRHNGEVPGRYESWFLSARDAEPGRPPRALWIRHTRHRAADATEGSAALWCTLFDHVGPQAVKQSLPEFPARAAAGPDGFHGEARARGRMAAWELTLSGNEPPLRHLRPAALYRLPLPRTKLEAPLPDGIASGRVVLDGRVQEVVGWRATAGHNWGAEHADRWVW